MLKSKEQLAQELQDMQLHELRTIIDTDYYRSMIACRKEDVNLTIGRLLDDLMLVKEGCVKAERYDLAILCRDKEVEMAMGLDLSLMI